MTNILMVASENDALNGGKVGGIGDVIRDIPAALAESGDRVTVVTPSYGFLHQINPIIGNASQAFSFAGERQWAVIHELEGKNPHPGVVQMTVDTPCLISPERRLYSDDPPDSPFATDANRFACFCAAVAEAVQEGIFEDLDVIHLHDWHTAFFLILREFHSRYQKLKQIRTVYSIHNLAYQGVRPFSGHASSLAAWFPEMHFDTDLLADPRWRDTVNPMAAGIRLADAVHTVSPSYAEEITQPSIKMGNRVFYGGEGLEEDIAAAKEDGRLSGILNGCTYPEHREKNRTGFDSLTALLRSHVLRWAGEEDALSPAHFLAHARLQEQGDRRPPVLLTSVGRITEQKMLIMRRSSEPYDSGLEGILQVLGDQGLLLLLGSGDPAYEQFLTRISARYDNFIFLRGYSNACARALYRNGDLFLMPSSFEPCGISQMLAMREGQPCLVHNVGGLKDTVRDGENGFVFGGRTVDQQVSHFVEQCREALRMKQESPEQWSAVCEAAKNSVFSWQETARSYRELLYRV